ncbi:DUF4231 domain-containing protein [Thermoactinospora rubra]|uniref:DUF4231 domain-containing protein n=1 Tax=Thermoactinospora rubra TaxID=1088767 RepID=UPI000A1057FA|nr:DUF4231 domain-containing protein [Thermoactinospora rubra]
MTTGEELGGIERVWRLQSVWSQAANRAKAAIGRSRLATLALGVAAAVLSVAAAQVSAVSSGAGRAMALAAAVAVGLGPLAARGASAAAVRDQTRLRSVAEALKADAYTYLAGVAPFRGEDRDRLLLDRAKALLDKVGDLREHVADVEPADRPPPPVHDVPSYLEHRVGGQIDGYYRPKAREMRERLRVVRLAEVTLGAVGVVLAAAAAVLEIRGLSAWVGVVTTVSGAVLAHAAAERLAFQQIEYSRTADELEDLRVRHLTTPVSEDDLVRDCEQVISIQNDAWMARLSGAEERQEGQDVP